MKRFLLGVVVGVAIGGLAVGIYSHRVTEKHLASLAFMEHLYSAEAASKILRVMDEERFDTARQLIRLELDSAVDASYRLMVSHQPDLGTLRNQLLPGLVQTEEYLAATDSENHLLAWLRDVNDYVENGSVSN